MKTINAKSMERLDTCHEDLRDIVLQAVQTLPFEIMVTCGHRNREDQEKAFKEGNSKLRWPKSKHNTVPSLAVDLVPFIGGKIPWEDIGKFKIIKEHMQGAAKTLGIKLVSGGDWLGFRDWPHHELKL